MGSLDEVLSAMLANDQGYSSTLASVMASSNSGELFALQNFQRAGSVRNAAEESSQWPAFARDQKWVLNGKNEAMEASSSSSLVDNNNKINNNNKSSSTVSGTTMQRYHSAPSSFLECLADFTDDAFSQGDGDLLEAFLADNLAPINERSGVQLMDTDPKLDATTATSLNEYEQFLASTQNSRTLSPPSTQPPGSQLAELRSLPSRPDHGLSTPDALGVRSRPTRINLLRQSSTPTDFLAAVQDSLESPDSPVFRMPSFDSSMSGVTSEADINGKSGNRVRGAEMATDPNGWLGNSSLRVRAGDPSSPGSFKLGLIRHSSLPAASRPFSPSMELDDLSEFSGPLPCKTRANRGFATHPRSIAERVRRTKISERMKKLQDLVPNMDRQTNTADMLDEAVEYVKHLQLQVQELSNTVVQLKERLVRCN